MNMELDLYDLTIIGGGPAGLYSAFYSGMRDMKVKLIEAKEELGGRLLLYPEKMIWDVGGVTPIRCEQLIRQLIQQAKTFDPAIVLGQEISYLERLDDGTMIVTAINGERHHTRTLILAIGYGVLKPVKLDIEGADRYEVTNLHYTVQELDCFRGKRVLISGGGDSAVDWANELGPIAAHVTIVHRREQFGGHEKNVKRMYESTIDVRTSYALTQLHGNEVGDAIAAVSLAPVDEEGQLGIEKERLEVDEVIISHGFRGDFGPIIDWGIEVGKWDIPVNEHMSTKLPGIFVAGDSVNFSAKVKLIAGAFNDAVLAVNSAKKYIDPEAWGMARVSSHNSIFKERNKSLGVAEEDA
ncbi:NAD(P)/FAD-dependent oxidoreductase [Paenibacillus sp. IB182496]|uniref:Ferredoxin--NADP reductase n=1 Tax=Paenibacillus sabuli TaxID=2772509 RepID=A0A927BR45_9BACL|nr:NAD(P)/FAD-dependent oxidoreductase [Paenibacillus sabuli]MBD2844386.1 NAD(P)/FAD-dependent oxidoreductase [Paenibacillus sabuli]